MNGKRLVAGFLLVFGFVVLIAAPAVIWFYPVPDILGGRRVSEANHDGYTVVAVCQVAFLASLPRRRLWSFRLSYLFQLR